MNFEGTQFSLYQQILRIFSPGILKFHDVGPCLANPTRTSVLEHLYIFLKIHNFFYFLYCNNHSSVTFLELIIQLSQTIHCLSFLCLFILLPRIFLNYYTIIQLSSIFIQLSNFCVIRAIICSLILFLSLSFSVSLSFYPVPLLTYVRMLM